MPNNRVFSILLPALLLFCVCCQAQLPYRSAVWSPDNGNGTYTNPVLHADYSDPDAIRVGSDFYMIASSFTQVPGLPILHSKDLVNWELIGHALPKLVPEDHFSIVQHGGGVWAPAIRYHNNEFYIYYPDPDFGIYLLKAKNINGPWSAPKLILPGKGIIDPCPFWDENGKCYLAHAFAGSRAGIKSILVIRELNAAGDSAVGDDVLVYDGHEKDPTIEGPKLYKRNGYYYLFAPAGGVSTGWQLVLRSKNIYGPYERKVVMAQGNTNVNGPHQGAWVNTVTGQDWFLHFQDKEAYGRVVHLQPMVWKNDWPVIGNDPDGDGTGEPVLQFKKPDVGKTYPAMNPAENEECNDTKPGLQWQWEANPQPNQLFCTANGSWRMFSVNHLDSAQTLWDMPNIIGQKFPAEQFTAKVKIRFYPKSMNEQFGLAVLGAEPAYISVIRGDGGMFVKCRASNPASAGITKYVQGNEFWLQLLVESGGICHFSYSTDGLSYVQFIQPFTAKPGKWIGARIGLFCTRNTITNDAGYADIDWFRIEKNQP